MEFICDGVPSCAVAVTASCLPGTTSLSTLEKKKLAGYMAAQNKYFISQPPLQLDVAL